MKQQFRSLLSTVASIILLFLFTSCLNLTSPVIPAPDAGSGQFLTFDQSSDSRHLLGFWNLDLNNQNAKPVTNRTLQDHTNVADYLLLPAFEGALEVNFDTFTNAGPFAPPAVKIKVTLTNQFGITGYNVRGIVIDDTGLIDVLNPDGCTMEWDIGDQIPLNAYMNFNNGGSSFPDESKISREFIVECPGGVIPPDLWFAVDVGTEGLIKAASSFPVANVNGAMRWPGDQAEIFCRVNDSYNFVNRVAAASMQFSGHPMLIPEVSSDSNLREFEATLDYIGGLGGGKFPLYFGAFSDLDVPTLAKTYVFVDPGPFPSGPIDSGCSQNSYNPARTCRTQAPIGKTLFNFTIQPPPSSSGIAIGLENQIVRRLENDQSLALQYPGLTYPSWTRLIGESDVASAPAIGNDGTIFYLEPELGRLKALFPDGSDRWTHQFSISVHPDLLLTSSPLGGLLIVVLRDSNMDTAIAAIGTDGHLRWQYDLANPSTGLNDGNRLAVSPGGTLYYTYPDGRILALDLHGAPKWLTTMGGWYSASNPVAGDDDSLYVLLNSGYDVACLESDGSTRWDVPIGISEFAQYPSLDYFGNMFVVIGDGGDNTGIRKLDRNDGSTMGTVQTGGARGYVVHGTASDFVYVQRDSPPGYGTCCDDFFVCRDGDMNIVWVLNTPGVTQIGAYPVVNHHMGFYVQGPDGLYVVTY